jgi:hypothetical protein
MNEKVIPIKTNENAEVCGKCGGQCCQWAPGILSVDQIAPGGDIQDFIREVRELLRSGKYILTNIGVQGLDKEFLAVAPRGSTSVGSSRFFNDNFGKCIFLKDDGCSLSTLRRPGECLLLIPDKDLKCKYIPEEQTQLRMKWLNCQVALRAVI